MFIERRASLASGQQLRIAQSRLLFVSAVVMLTSPLDLFHGSACNPTTTEPRPVEAKP